MSSYDPSFVLVICVVLTAYPMQRYQTTESRNANHSTPRPHFAKSASSHPLIALQSTPAAHISEARQLRGHGFLLGADSKQAKGVLPDFGQHSEEEFTVSIAFTSNSGRNLSEECRDNA